MSFNQKILVVNIVVAVVINVTQSEELRERIKCILNKYFDKKIVMF